MKLHGSRIFLIGRFLITELNGFNGYRNIQVLPFWVNFATLCFSRNLTIHPIHIYQCDVGNIKFIIFITVCLIFTHLSWCSLCHSWCLLFALYHLLSCLVSSEDWKIYSSFATINFWLSWSSPYDYFPLCYYALALIDFLILLFWVYFVFVFAFLKYLLIFTLLS